jgi:polysaccharide export outer membrane protein
MSRMYSKICGLSLALTLMFLLMGASEAQNFATFVPVEGEKTQAQEYLADEDIEQILVNEGIPLTTDFSPQSESKYTLGPADVIEISVMRHPEVSGQFSINQEGKIQYNFIGDVEVAGLTKQEVTQKVNEKLSKYIIAPEVTVKIVGYNSKVVYVIGEVGSPGKIYMHGDTITVREALIQAGLPLLSAKAGASRLITPSADGKPNMKIVNIQKLLYEGDLRENIVMNPGDTLFVPPTFLAKAMRVLSPVAQPIGTASGLGRTVTTGF